MLASSLTAPLSIVLEEVRAGSALSDPVLTQDFRPFVLAEVLRARTDEGGWTIKDRNSDQVDLCSHKCSVDGDHWKD